MSDCLFLTASYCQQSKILQQSLEVVLVGEFSSNLINISKSPDFTTRFDIVLTFNLAQYENLKNKE